MTNEQFEALAPQDRVAYLLGVASRMFGRATVQKVYSQVKPLVDDMIGHGHMVSSQIPGMRREGAPDYWKGVWKIYDAE